MNRDGTQDRHRALKVFVRGGRAQDATFVHVSLLPPNLPVFVPDARYSLEQWLQIEEATGQRYEFHDGQLLSVEAMAGGSFMHAVLGINIGHALLTEFESSERHRACSGCSNDLRIAVDGGTRYLYADLAVVCGSPAFDEFIPTAVINPVAVFEVLSPSSQGYDRGRKFDFYRGLASSREYVLVDQERPLVEVRSRVDATTPWTYRTVVDPEGAAALPALGITLAMPRVYRNWEAPRG